MTAVRPDPATVPRSVVDTVRGLPDLWCTYAATRTAAWLGTPRREADIASWLASRRNSDGGYAWAPGMPSDAWATFYCTQGLADIGVEPARGDRTRDWLTSLRTADGGYGMTPGQPSEAWATHYVTRTLIEGFGERVPEPESLRQWLADLQTVDGGLSWSPAWAGRGGGDVRACFYGLAAWRALSTQTEAELPWDRQRLISWIEARQDADGGFRLHDHAEQACQWATYRAVAALQMLGTSAPRPLAPWLAATTNAAGQPVRWRGGAETDVWACFCSVGAVTADGGDLSTIRPMVEAAIDTMRVDGGFTYREITTAADALSVSAALLGRPEADPGLRTWLESCQLPNEGGVMYMPARGAEVRCTLWALAAGAFADQPDSLARIGGWLAEIQNPDGGFGYWEGRGSDLLSTAAAVEIATRYLPAGAAPIDSEAVLDFVSRCRMGAAYANVPGQQTGARSTLQAERIRAALRTVAGDAVPTAAGSDGETSTDVVTDTLVEHQVRGGGFADQGARMPDLLTSYEAAVAIQRAGRSPEPPGWQAFLTSVASDEGVAWTPMAPPTDDPLPRALIRLLNRWLDGDPTPLPGLVLS